MEILTYLETLKENTLFKKSSKEKKEFKIKILTNVTINQIKDILVNI